MFAMHFVHNMFPNLFAENEWDYFLGIYVGSNDALPFPAWANPDRKESFQIFSATYPSIIKQLSIEDDKYWSNWNISLEPEKELFIKYKNISLF